VDPKLIIIIAFCWLYGLFEIIMGLRQRQKSLKDVVKTGDQGSFWILCFLIGIGFFLSFNIATSGLGKLRPWDTFFAIGATCSIGGLIIRIKSILTLKHYFTYTVTKIQNHQLIETWLYKYVRHPSYLGQFMIFVGIATALSNWLSIVTMIVPCLIGFMYRIKVEEQFMLKQLGQKYMEYRKRTKKLIPMIY
jgi:protein-S-isoprenylcysteine O-methyltransferase Ste14